MDRSSPQHERVEELLRVQHFLSDQAFHSPKPESIGKKSRQQDRLRKNERVVDHVTQLLLSQGGSIGADPGVRPTVSGFAPLSGVGTQYPTNTDEKRVADVALDDAKL